MRVESRLAIRRTTTSERTALASLTSTENRTERRDSFRTEETGDTLAIGDKDDILAPEHVLHGNTKSVNTLRVMPTVGLLHHNAPTTINSNLIASSQSEDTNLILMPATDV
ncbi:hypothetical protein BLNAU_12331 [Blattamonas nauphoetae]|uniref:Uncharacterized protein n=1 Tax=Blattamonas nauphoetae TaxID=2049346 RepID=A0ABQ9XMQ1_9EUKA|nr:hypothetical protein BLNAU_12331 [Blattamonas nauphoetae]